jgi:hypothetical protein
MSYYQLARALVCYCLHNRLRPAVSNRPEVILVSLSLTQTAEA